MLTFHIKSEFRSRLLESLVGVLFDEGSKPHGGRVRTPRHAALPRLPIGGDPAWRSPRTPPRVRCSWMLFFKRSYMSWQTLTLL
jgi:hypothetical protein